MATLELRRAIVDTLRMQLPNVDIEEHPRAGLDERDISDALRNRALALRVAFTGVPLDAQDYGVGTDAPQAWAIYVLTKDVADAKRDVLALRVIDHLLRLVTKGAWPLDCDIATLGRATRVRAVPMYEGEPDQKSAAIWAVTWIQSATFMNDRGSWDLRDLLQLVTRYDLAPKDGDYEASDTIRMRSP